MRVPGAGIKSNLNQITNPSFYSKAENPYGRSPVGGYTQKTKRRSFKRPLFNLGNLLKFPLCFEILDDFIPIFRQDVGATFGIIFYL